MGPRSSTPPAAPAGRIARLERKRPENEFAARPRALLGDRRTIPVPNRDKCNPSAPPTPSNAFHPGFLRLLDERDEPITAPEADMAGPWLILPVPGLGLGLFREGEPPSRGFRPVAVFGDRFLALLTAAALPGVGRYPLLSLSRDPDPDPDPEDQGYAVRLDDGTVVGHLMQCDQPLLESGRGWAAWRGRRGGGEEREKGRTAGLREAGGAGGPGRRAGSLRGQVAEESLARLWALSE